MFACLYDKSLNALHKSVATYPTSKWSLTRKAYEFDELSITTAMMDNSVKAMFIGLHNDDGSLKYLAFSGKPSSKEGMTTYNGTDLRQVFKQKLAINFDATIEDGYYPVNGQTVYKTKLQRLYEYLMEMCVSSVMSGFGGSGLVASVDASDIGENAPTWNDDWYDFTPGIIDVWDSLQALNMMYDCYIVAEVNLATKKVVFKVKRITEEISFKLSDFNEAKVINSSSITNCIEARHRSNSDDEYGILDDTYYLLSDDRIISNSDLGSNTSYVIYPMRKETILEDTADKSVSKAVEKLMKNRFQGKVDINTDCAMGYLLKRIDLNTFGKVYGYNSADNDSYRRLPIMSIAEDETGKVRVSFGRLSQFWYAK